MTLREMARKELARRALIAQQDWSTDTTLLMMGSFRPTDADRYEGASSPEMVSCFKLLVRWSLGWGLVATISGAAPNIFSRDTTYPSKWTTKNP